MIPVRRCCRAAELALKLGQVEEAVALCRHILAHRRGYLRAHLLLAQACLEQERWEEARERFRLVAAVDPECAEAWSGLGVIALAQGNLEEAVRFLGRALENTPESEEVREALQQALARRAGRPVPPPSFTPACVGRFYLRRGLPQPAAEAYATALRNDPDRDDLRLAYATALFQAGMREQAGNLVRPLLERTPRPLGALLLAAAGHFLRGEVEEGRRLWGEARAWDPEDLRARSLFGDLPGLPLPPDSPEIPAPESAALNELLAMADRVEESGGAAALAPASTQELASYAGQLRAKQARPLSPADPDLRRFQAAVEDVHQRLLGGEAPPTSPSPPTAYGGQPAEVLLAWEAGLRARFGDEGASRVDLALQELSQAAEQRGVTGRLVYLDRPPYPELARPDPRDPQQIKAFLDELDRRLAEEGLDLRYLSLIGGDDLLPFARLENPAQDMDEVVLSDNLYASRDPTYLIPERATGRFPDGGEGSERMLVALLNRAAAWRRGERPSEAPSGCLGMFFSWLPFLGPFPKSSNPQRRFGLSAQVWAQASQAVFGLLPGGEPLYLCPPTRVLPSFLAGVPLAYFNLHGSAESPNWYGQRDLSLSAEGPLMPVAFTPEQVPAGQIEGQVVFSEACYGAYILGKTPASSLALRFLSEGALGFVGSTMVSYGVSVPPLADADLLGQFFWQHVLAGESLGEALLQAKVDLTREMYTRQGYLDGDDMKTLLEFVLYGDPLAALGTSPKSKAAFRTVERLSPPLLCGKHAKTLALHQLSEDLVERVRRSIAWLQQDAEVGDIEVALRAGCPTGVCSVCRAVLNRAEPDPEALFFTSRRELRAEDGTRIPQWTRVVVDPGGRITKMVVTR
ncbi:MAG: tetratricopeptide repeat protein [Chloroflexia bacterium]